MKKKYLLIPVFAALALTVASCDKKENTVKFKDAEGNEQEVVVKPTDDSTQTANALYAVTQAASANDYSNLMEKLTLVSVEFNENIDAKLSDTEYAKANIKLVAAMTNEGTMSASIEGDADVNVTALQQVAGASNIKANGKANAYYDLTTATDKAQPNLYFDYDAAYTLAGVETKAEGKYYVTAEEMTQALQGLATKFKDYLPTEGDLENPGQLISNLPAGDIADELNLKLETEADFKAFVEQYGITVSAVSSTEIEFAMEYKIEDALKLVGSQMDATTLAAMKVAYKDITVPFKVAFNTEWMLPSKLEVNYGAVLTSTLKTSMPTYTNATVNATSSLTINYNGGSVKKLASTADYKDIQTAFAK